MPRPKEKPLPRWQTREGQAIPGSDKQQGAGSIVAGPLQKSKEDMYEPFAVYLADTSLCR